MGARFDNPVRRSRTLGAPGHGVGQFNRLVIPRPRAKHLAPYWERLGPHRVVRRTIHCARVDIVVERTREGCVHACTVDDVVIALASLPAEDVARIATVVLRQPTRKQALLDGCWGRWTGYANVAGRGGATIFLESGPAEGTLYWPADLSPDQARELDRLRDDGHRVTLGRREYELEYTLASVRATQLYRTLLHEVGHHVDYEAHSARAWALPPDERDAARDAFWSRPVREREDFAHRYADAHRRELFAQGVFPFARRDDRELLARAGLDPADFGV